MVHIAKVTIFPHLVLILLFIISKSLKMSRPIEIKWTLLNRHPSQTPMIYNCNVGFPNGVHYRGVPLYLASLICLYITLFPGIQS